MVSLPLYRDGLVDDVGLDGGLDDGGAGHVGKERGVDGPKPLTIGPGPNGALAGDRYGNLEVGDGEGHLNLAPLS